VCVIIARLSPGTGDLIGASRAPLPGEIAFESDTFFGFARILLLRGMWKI
jgi:hypothetical protein